MTEFSTISIKMPTNLSTFATKSAGCGCASPLIGRKSNSSSSSSSKNNNNNANNNNNNNKKKIKAKQSKKMRVF